MSSGQSPALDARRLKYAFGVTFALSILWMFFFRTGHISYIGCLGIGGVYIWFFYSHSQREKLTQQFGDSLYYLGFLMTVAALILSLQHINSKSEALDVAAVFSLFSIALVTTLAGLLGRVMVNHFSDTLEAESRQAERSLAQKTSEFIAQLQASTVQLRQFHEERATEMQESLEVSRKAMQELVGEGVSAMQKYAEKLDDGNIEHQSQLHEKFEELISSAGEISEKLRKTELPDALFAKSLAPSVERASEKLDQVQVQLDNAANAFGKIAERNQELSKAFAGSLKAVESFVATHDRYERASEQFEKMVHSMKKGSVAVEEFTSTTQRERELLGQQLANMKENLEELSSVRTAMTARVVELNNVCQNLAEGLSDTGDFVVARLAKDAR